MRRVRLVDAPGVAWTLAQGFTPSRATAVASWPAWLLAAALDVNLLHAERRVVLALRRGPGLTWRHAFRALLLVAGALATVVLADAVTRPLLGVPVGTLLPVAFLLAGVPTIVALLLRARSSSPQTRKIRPARYDATWTIDMLAARPRAGGLAIAAAHVASVVRPGEAIVACAATERHVRAYRRYGFVVIDEHDPLVLRRPGRVEQLLSAE